MHSTRRSTTPVRLHQFWDAVDRCSTDTQGPVDFERIVTIVTSMHKVPRDELNRELEAAIRDELIASDVIQSQKREEREVYKLPEQEPTKGDHDWYCFHCHLGAGGSVVACGGCPRIFHVDCLPDDRKPDKDLFVCPPCHVMATKSSDEVLNPKPKQLSQLLEYSCRRFKDWGIPQLNSADGATWAIASNREAKDEWRYDLLVYFSIDLSQMLEKAVDSKYQSLEEFQVDCETLVHEICVYFGVEQLKGQAIAASFHKDVLHDIQEIKLCHDCFHRSNERQEIGPWWFCLPCTTPHEVVWAKQSGYPYWPAKIMKVDGPKYDVRYFGGNYERAMIDVKNIQPIDTPLNSLKIRKKTTAWNEAYKELEHFLEIAKNPEKIDSLPATKASKRVTPAYGSGTAAKSRGTSAKADVEEAVTKRRKIEVNNDYELRSKAPPRVTGVAIDVVHQNVPRRNQQPPVFFNRNLRKIKMEVDFVIKAEPEEVDYEHHNDLSDLEPGSPDAHVENAHGKNDNNHNDSEPTGPLPTFKEFRKNIMQPCLERAMTPEQFLKPWAFWEDKREKKRPKKKQKDVDYIIKADKKIIETVEEELNEMDSQVLQLTTEIEKMKYVLAKFQEKKETLVLDKFSDDMLIRSEVAREEQIERENRGRKERNILRKMIASTGEKLSQTPTEEQLELSDEGSACESAVGGANETQGTID